MKTIIHENNYSNLQQFIQLLISKLLDQSKIYTINKKKSVTFEIHL